MYDEAVVCTLLITVGCAGVYWLGDAAAEHAHSIPLLYRLGAGQGRATPLQYRETEMDGRWCGVYEALVWCGRAV